MSKSAIKLGIAVVLFLLAGVLWVTLRPVEEKSRVADNAMKPDYVCTKCGQHFQLTYDEMLAAAPATNSEDSGGEQRVRGGRGASRKPAMINCPKCKEATAQAAIHCAEHDMYYPQFMEDGSRGKCPKCP